MGVQITSSQYPYNAAGWLCEKSRHILEFAVRLHEQLKARDDLPSGFIDDVNSCLWPIVYDATKMLSFSNGAKWSPADRDIILNRGAGGLEEVLVKYGLLDQTTKAKKKAQEKQELSNFLEQLQSLLGGEASPSRTFIHDLLRKTTVKHPIIVDISNLTERLTMRELTWEAYVRSVSELIVPLRAQDAETQT